MPSLVVVSGPNEGAYYPMGQRTVVIGRDESCPIQIVDDLVSRKHVQIRFDASSNDYIATDMKSANGLLVNGRRIEGEITLVDGDAIEIGKSRINYYTGDFADRDSAWAHYKQRGQKFKNTLES
ncbi:MAG: FHA domain-containing protein [Planctomycetes bacterium]|nr:FHA domain-containing protein [Planctomycetota bacterium]NOG53229.1 FHA domain-containing protein [Planctomycetota bacterium]